MDNNPNNQPTQVQPTATQPAKTQPTSQPSTPTTPAAEQPKTETTSKKKKAIIGGIIGGAVVLIAAITGGVYYYLHSSPEMIALDAFSSLQDMHGMTLYLNDAYNYSSGGSETTDIKIEGVFDDNFRHELTCTIFYKRTFSIDDLEDEIIEFSFDEAFQEDGILYVKTDMAYEYFKHKMQEDYGSDISDSVFNDWFKSIDGTWWKVSLEDILDKVNPDNPKDNKTYVKAYNCALDYMRETIGKYDKNQIIKNYKKNRFLEVEEYNHSLYHFNSLATIDEINNGKTYSISFKPEEFVNFYNATVTEDMKNDFIECVKDVELFSDEVEEIEDTDDIDVEISADNVNESKFIISVNGWHHRMAGLYYQADTSSLHSVETILLPSYTKAKVNMPSDSKPVTDLYDSFVDIMNTSTGANIDTDIEIDDLYDF